MWLWPSITLRLMPSGSGTRSLRRQVVSRAAAQRLGGRAPFVGVGELAPGGEGLLVGERLAGLGVERERLDRVARHHRVRVHQGGHRDRPPASQRHLDPPVGRPQLALALAPDDGGRLAGGAGAADRRLGALGGRRARQLAGAHLVGGVAHQVEVDLGRQVAARDAGRVELRVALGRAVGDDQGVQVGHRRQVVDERAHEADHGLVEVGADRGDRVEALLSQPPPSQDVVALAHRRAVRRPSRARPSRC